MRVALIHDWLVSNRGGERVLEALLELFPQAPIFTLVHAPGSVPRGIERRTIHTSFLQRIPGIARRYREFLPLMPKAIESFDLSGFDLIVSSSHCVAKGVRKPLGTRHLSYVHAPMRYMWDLFDEYFGPGRASLPVRAAAAAARPFLQRWDRESARRVDRFVANSENIGRKIERIYERAAHVVYPPVDVRRFADRPLGEGKGGYFLWLGALAPYKRVDLAIEAFRRTGLPLWIAGAGQDEGRLRSLPSNVKVLGRVPDDELPDLYADARALIFPGEEDFGITPVEAQAAGRPVIALGRGGALETVTAKTGVFFEEKTPDSLVEALTRFEAFERSFVPADARANAGRFSKERFLTEMAVQVRALTG